MELLGKTILITRAASQSQELRQGLEAAGARVLECPVVEIAPVEDWTHVDEAIHDLDSFDWLLFTSTNAVDMFMNRINGAGVQCRVPVAVVGSATAGKVRQWGLTPALVPNSYRAEGLLEAFPRDMTGKRILYPRAETARELLPEALEQRGAAVHVVTVYRTTGSASGLARLRPVLLSERVDCLVLTSPSAIHFVAEALGSELKQLLKGIVIAVIGPVALESAQAAGLDASIQPERATVPDLIDSIKQYFKMPNG